jgi:tRNA-dihydrouridine synthase A
MDQTGARKSRSSNDLSRRFCVAPMMDWTDRHDRFFLRLLSKRAVLYTEMLTTGAVIFGERDRLMGFSTEEHPVAFQLGGSDPAELGQAAQIAEDFGYDEINLNVGCPSDRVQAGRFGACLMKEPALVAECIAAMQAAVNVPVTVKSRIGVDEQVPEEVLPAFIETVAHTGCHTFIIHARKAWLDGLSPKDNRTVPPLDYDLVYKMKVARPDLEIIINGGIDTLDAAAEHIRSVDGVMLGRAAYQDPYLLAGVDSRFYGEAGEAPSRADAVEGLRPYIAAHLEAGGRFHQITRHILGLYHGLPGARRWRRTLTAEGAKPGAGLEVLDAALDAVEGFCPPQRDEGSADGYTAITC